jgi:hypothetical protein
MAEEFWLEFHSAKEADDAAAVLSAITLDGEPCFFPEREANAIITGFRIRRQIPESAVLSSPSANASSDFFDIFYAIEGLKSGMHHQDGLFWIRDPRVPKGGNPRVSLETVAPTILHLLDVPAPSYMKEPLLAGELEMAAH